MLPPLLFYHFPITPKQPGSSFICLIRHMIIFRFRSAVVNSQVARGLSPSALLTEAEERLPVVAEMLDLTTKIL